MSAGATCELCSAPGGELIWRDERCRVIGVADENFPGFCRVVWNDHVAELSDLAESDRTYLIKVVCIVETAVREITGADKINLASFGNVVPHLHWHVIPRWRDDSHFPQPIWGSPQRPGTRRKVDNAALARLICNRLAAPR